MNSIQPWLQSQIHPSGNIGDQSLLTATESTDEYTPLIQRNISGVVNGFQEYCRGAFSPNQHVLGSASTLFISHFEQENTATGLFITGASWIFIDESSRLQEKEMFVNEVGLDLSTLPINNYSKVMIRAKFVGRARPPVFD